jgi:hypothetical protein
MQKWEMLLSHGCMANAELNRVKEEHSLIAKTHRLGAFISRVCPPYPGGDDRIMKRPLVNSMAMLLLNHLHG